MHNVSHSDVLKLFRRYIPQTIQVHQVSPGPKAYSMHSVNLNDVLSESADKTSVAAAAPNLGIGFSSKMIGMHNNNAVRLTTFADVERSIADACASLARDEQEEEQEDVEPWYMQSPTRTQDTDVEEPGDERLDRFEPGMRATGEAASKASHGGSSIMTDIAPVALPSVAELATVPQSEVQSFDGSGLEDGGSIIELNATADPGDGRRISYLVTVSPPKSGWTCNDRDDKDAWQAVATVAAVSAASEAHSDSRPGGQIGPQAVSRPRKRTRHTFANRNGTEAASCPALVSARGSRGDRDAISYLPITAAASAVGLPKAVVQRWVADGQVAFIRPRENNSHRLVELADLRRMMQKKRESSRSTVAVAQSRCAAAPTTTPTLGPQSEAATLESRVLVYARIDPEPTAPPRDNHLRPLSPEDNHQILSQCQRVATAINLVPGTFLYGGDIASADDWSNRPSLDQMLDKVEAHEIDRVAVLSSDHLAHGTAFSLLEWICNRNDVELVCVDQL